MEYAVETFSLTKVFSDWWGRAKVYAVNDLNLKINSNEVFGLLGPNGSGKTTTIKMLLGLLNPTKGRALVLGGASTEPKISARVGYLPEESYLYRYLTARETLEFYGKLFGLSGKIRKMRIESLLDMVGLRAVGNRQVGTFSKGMARRIGLAQALINDPDLLILDEPTTGLDPIGTRQIKDLIVKLAERGKTILLCSHLLADVEDVCDRISILYGGKIQAAGEVRQLLQQSGRRQIMTGPISDEAVKQIRSIVEKEDADCEIDTPLEKLESFFIKTVAEAQKQEQPTSGAVSTTRIDGFLAETKDADRILDKLVSADVSPEQPSEEVPTEPVAPARQKPEPDKGLLSELTHEKKPPGQESTKPVEPAPVKPVDTEKKDVNRSILDELTSGQEDRDSSPDEQVADEEREDRDNG